MLYNRLLRILRSAAALLLCAVFVFCLVGCSSGGKENSGKAGESEKPSGELKLTDAQEARIMELAAAFRQYGEFKNTGNTEFSRLEYIVFCMFTDKLADCPVGSFGTVAAEDADAAIHGVFGDMKIMDVMRRPYDADADQTYYFKNGSYYVMRTDNSAYTYRMISARETSDENGVLLHEVRLGVQRDGEDELYLTLTLVPDDASVYRMSACGIELCY